MVNRMPKIQIRELEDGWQFYYNPYTAESGLEYVEQWNPILTAPVFIGSMPIRKDVQVKYADINVPRFQMFERIGYRILGMKQPDIDPDTAELIRKSKAHDPMFTCFTCVENETCKWAWDLYNTNGDCIAEK